MATALVRSLQRVAPRRARYLAGTPSYEPKPPRSRTTSCKVEDRTLHLTAIDEDGQRHAILGLTGHNLVKTLVQSGLMDPERHIQDNIYACSGQCQVSVAKEWLEKLPPRSKDETHVLKVANGDKVDEHARLGCQIVLTPALEGMVFAIAEEKPWRTL